MDQAPMPAGRRDSGEFLAATSCSKAARRRCRLLLDGSDSNTAAIAQGYAEGVVQPTRSAFAGAAQSTHAGSVPPACVSAEVRVWYNPDLLSRNFIVPGLIAVIMMIIAAQSEFADHRARMGKRHHGAVALDAGAARRNGAGKTVRLFRGGLRRHARSALVVGVFIFDVPFKGSLLLLLILQLLSSCSARSGSGSMVSAMFRTQLMAYQMGTLTSFLPAFLLSGFIYPISSMPRVIQAVSCLVPARYFIDMSQGSVPEGHRRWRLLWFESAAADRLRRARFLLRGPQAAAEGGLSHATTPPRHHSQRIHPGAARSAHARHAVPAAADPVADLRLRREPGRG